MYSEQDTARAVGCPIRRSRDQRSLASPPGFSQRATSFIASQCQGIHQMPLLALERHTQRQGPSRYQNAEFRHQKSEPQARFQRKLRFRLPRRRNCVPPGQTLLSEDTAGSSHGLTAARSPATVTQLASLRLSINKCPSFPNRGCSRHVRVLLAASS